MLKTVQARAFAKINVGLKILGKRPDGFHEIRTVYQTVGLADRLQISLSSGKNGIRLECEHPELSSGRANLVYRAAELWRRARGFKGGISLRLEKKIPMGAGLGGGSSDAAATLLALERLSGNRLESAACLQTGREARVRRSFVSSGRARAGLRPRRRGLSPDGPSRRVIA